MVKMRLYSPSCISTQVNYHAAVVKIPSLSIYTIDLMIPLLRSVSHVETQSVRLHQLQLRHHKSHGIPLQNPSRRLLSQPFVIQLNPPPLLPINSTPQRVSPLSLPHRHH